MLDAETQFIGTMSVMSDKLTSTVKYQRHVLTILSITQSHCLP